MGRLLGAVVLEPEVENGEPRVVQEKPQRRLLAGLPHFRQSVGLPTGLTRVGRNEEKAEHGSFGIVVPAADHDAGDVEDVRAAAQPPLPHQRRQLVRRLKTQPVHPPSTLALALLTSSSSNTAFFRRVRGFFSRASGFPASSSSSSSPSSSTDSASRFVSVPIVPRQVAAPQRHACAFLNPVYSVSAAKGADC